MDGDAQFRIMPAAPPLVRWVPRLLLGTAALHICFGLAAAKGMSGGTLLPGILDDGVIGSVSGRMDREAIFWFLATGVVWLSLGHLATWAVRHTGRLPALVGWWSVGLAVPGIVLMPVSGMWLVLAIGLLALVAARQAGRAAVDVDRRGGRPDVAVDGRGGRPDVAVDGRGRRAGVAVDGQAGRAGVAGDRQDGRAGVAGDRQAPVPGASLGPAGSGGRGA